MIAKLLQLSILLFTSVQLSAQCAADICQEAETLVTITPADCAAGENIISYSGCIPDGATSEDVYISCMSGEAPTVWYKIEIDSDQATMLTAQVDAIGFDPQWSVWQSLDDNCDNMINVSQPQPDPEPAIPCGGLEDDTQNFIIPIVQDPSGTPATYWIAITALGEITDPNFTLNYASSLGCIACSSDDSFDCDNGEFTAFINGEEVGLEDYQNFPPGQEVEVCFSFDYNTIGSGNDWLHGIIPTFGNGWDLEASNIESQDLGGEWEWFDAEGECSTTTSIYALPNLCTYSENGILKLCNTACDPTCPCEGPLLPNSTLPSAWFWNSTGASTTCDTLSCKPLHYYGWPSGFDVQVEACINLKVKILGDDDQDGERDCLGKNDLRISFQTTSDGVTGCWEDNPCIVDPSIMGPNWEVNCAAQVIPTIVFVDEEEDGVYDGNEVLLEDYSVGINSGEWQTDISANQHLVLTEGENTVEILLDDNDYELTTNQEMYDVELSQAYNTDTLLWGVKPLNVNVTSIDKDEISLLPNPTTDVINIEYLGQNFAVELYTATGKFITKKMTNSGSIIINMEDMEYGIYIVKVKDTELSKSTTMKVVKL